MADTPNVPLDKRTIDRYLEKGVIDKKAYESYIAKLPDDTANAEWVQTDLLEADFTDTGDDDHRLEAEEVEDDEDESEGDIDDDSDEAAPKKSEI